jgi:hypothetical protein
MPSPKPGHTEFAAMVPDEILREFRENFPIYGAQTWFITESLKAVNQLFRENPSLKSVVQISVSKAIAEAK